MFADAGGAPGNALIFLQRWHSGGHAGLGSRPQSVGFNGNRRLLEQVRGTPLEKEQLQPLQPVTFLSLQALFKLSGFHKDRWQQWISGFNQAHLRWRGSRPEAQTHQQDSEWTQSPHWREDGDDALGAQREADCTSQKQQVVKTRVCERHTLKFCGWRKEWKRILLCFLLCQNTKPSWF